MDNAKPHFYLISNVKLVALFKFGIVDKLLYDKSSTCSRVRSLNARALIIPMPLPDILIHLGDENLLNSLTIFRICPSVTDNESSRFRNFADTSSSSRVAFCMCTLVQYDELSVFGLATHDMARSISVTLQQTNEFGMVGCAMHSLHVSLSRDCRHKSFSA